MMAAEFCLRTWWNFGRDSWLGHDFYRQTSAYQSGKTMLVKAGMAIQEELINSITRLS